MNGYVGKALVGDLLEWLQHEFEEEWHFLEFVKRKVEDLPAADVAPVKRGRWEVVAGDDLIIDYVCSSCGEMSEYECCFCPNCGADMRGDEDAQIC